MLTMKNITASLLLSYCLCSCLLLISPATWAQQNGIPPYKNKQLPIAERVKDVLTRMTPEEKFYQLFMIPGEIAQGQEELYKKGLFGFQMSATSSDGNINQQILSYQTNESALALVKKINKTQQFFIEQTRLGIPMLAFDEALHGLVREGATAFPQSIGLAASWNTRLMERVAKAIAHETAIRGIKQVLSPVINVATDVRWGRTEETYGEDPYLVSAMGLAFIQAFEQKGIITTPKHFIANTGDGGRDSYPIQLSERAMAEIHYPPFITAFKKGKARSVMTSYNSGNGSPATANHYLLNQLLKEKWQFNGFVISDASAVGGANVLHYTAKDYADAGKIAITNGLDVIFQTSIQHQALFIPPFLNKQIEQKRLDDAVSRVLTAKFELGLFDQPYINESLASDTSFFKAHQQLAREAARESMVLLKNQSSTLPISQATSIALIGMDATEDRLGGYSGPGNQKITILQGLQDKMGKDRVQFAPGPGRTGKHPVPVPAAALTHSNNGKQYNGLAAKYYHNIDLSGDPALQRLDPAIHLPRTFMGPAAKLSTGFYSVEWNGFLEAPASGSWQIGLEGNDGYRLYIGDRLVIDRWNKESYHTQMIEQSFEKGKSYPIRVQFKEPLANGKIRLVWDYGQAKDEQNKIDEAAALAATTDIAIVVAGIEEGEFRDRASLALPGHQEALIKAVSAKAKKTIVVLIGGSAITMTPWIDQVDAIVYAWYPGEQGGHALADVLTGEYNPAGRLPITFPMAEGQLPLVYNHKPTGRGDDYVDMSGLPLFPFGYGLSYTQFNYDNLQISRQQINPKDSIQISCRVRNTGLRAGDEVVQVYLQDQLASVARPVMELKGFQRIHLKAGEEKILRFTIHPEQLEMLNDRMQTVIEPGSFRVMIGASSRDIRLNGQFFVQ